MTSHCSCSKSVVLLTLQYPPCYISYAWQMTPNLCMLQIHSQCIQNVIICIQNCFMYKSLSVFSISGRIAGCKFLVPKDTRSVVQKLFFTATDFRNLALRRRCLVRSRDRFLLFPHVCHVHLNFATFV